VNVNSPDADGVPQITPVRLFKPRPGGKLPLSIVHAVTQSLVDVASRVCEYAVLSAAFANFSVWMMVTPYTSNRYLIFWKTTPKVSYYTLGVGYSVRQAVANSIY
jgi:hypothetical protein